MSIQDKLFAFTTEGCNAAREWLSELGVNIPNYFTGWEIVDLANQYLRDLWMNS